MIPRTLAALPIALIVPIAATQAAAAPSDGAFVDEFDALDADRWFVSDGWNNGDHQNCDWSADRVRVEGGALRLEFGAGQTENRDYACAEVQTRDTFGPGTFEVRMRAPRASGLVGAFFTYGGPPTGPVHDEIDVELLLKDPSRVQFNTYVDAKGGNEELVPLPVAADEAFHDYAFVWEADRVAFFVDGELRHEITGRGKVPSEPGKIFLSLWGSDTLSSWTGPFAPPPSPLTLDVERVLYTPLGEPCPDAASACAPVASDGVVQ